MLAVKQVYILSNLFHFYAIADLALSAKSGYDDLPLNSDGSLAQTKVRFKCPVNRVFRLTECQTDVALLYCSVV